MKFACDQCDTKYSIADERVHGRVLKIRCKTCNNVITVREDMAQAETRPATGASSGQAGAPAARPPQAAEWYVSFDGDQEGPYTLDRASERGRLERGRGKEAFAWKAGFAAWLPIEQVPDLARAIAAGSRPATVSGPAGKPGAKPAAAGAAASGAAAAGAAAAGAAARVATDTAGMARAAQQATTGAAARSTAPQAATTGAAPSTPAIDRSRPQTLMGTGPAAAATRTPLRSGGAQPDLFGAAARGEGSAAAPLPARSAAPGTPAAAARREGARGGDQDAFAAAALGGGSSAAAATARPAPASQGGGRISLADLGAEKAAQGNAATTDSSGFLVGEASGLISLAHLAQAVTQPRPGAVRPAAPAGALSAGTAGSAPVAAPPPQTGMLKFAAIGGLLGMLALGGVIIFLVMNRPKGENTVTERKIIIDSPIMIADPGGPGPAASATEGDQGKHPDRRRAAARAPVKGTGPAGGQPGQPNQGGGLAGLYGEDGPGGRDLKGPERGAGGGGQVSQQAILAVVTQNRRALNLCYDRVLKHDTSLKRARVVVRVKVGISGSVTNVSVPDPQYSGSEIGDCISGAIKKWHFPNGDSEYETELPILLQAN